MNPANLVSLRALYTHDAAAIPDALAARLTELGLYVPHFDFRAMERFPALRTIVPDCFINEPVPADLFGRVPQAERWVLPPQRERLPGIMHMKAGNVRVLVTGAPGLSPGFRVGPVTTLRPSSDGCLRRVEISWEGGPLGFGGWVAGAFRHLDDVEALVVKRSPRFKPHVVAAIEVEAFLCNHPAVRMWLGHPEALLAYQVAICGQWTLRGYKDTCLDKTYELLLPVLSRRGADFDPPWLGDDDLHLSHRSNLLRKAPEHYGLLWPGTPDDLPYKWPC